MRIAQGILGFHIVTPITWRADWAWGVALIVLTVVMHVTGLGLMNRGAVLVFPHLEHRRQTWVGFAMVMGTLSLLATSLHALEASVWAASYWVLGALPDYKSAMLYSLNALTSYGHESLILENRWRLMGAIEALNGWLLFGLTTAFLFGMMEKVWLLGGRKTGY